MQFRYQDYLQLPRITIVGYPDEFIPQFPFNFGHVLGVIGVDLFFIISGFLITSLLLHEEKIYGSISVRAFYTRRVFRILPAFYAYLLAIIALRVMGLVHVPYSDILRSGAFLSDLHRFPSHWFVGHTWSLSVEEQFYVVWPALLIVFAKARGWLGLACFVGLLALSPVSPLANRFCYIAIGVLYAVSPRAKREIDAIGARPWAPLLAIGLFAIAFLPPGLLFLYKILVAAGPVLLAVLFFGALAKRGPLSHLIDLVWLQRLGLISYSVYLWQQLSLGPAIVYEGNWLLSLPFFFLAPALISYFVIERPFIRIGRRLSKRIERGNAPVLLGLGNSFTNGSGNPLLTAGSNTFLNSDMTNPMYVGFSVLSDGGITKGDDVVLRGNISAAPEPSTWAMMLLGFAGYRRSEKGTSSAA
jgi:peptidoglycan/LPS O-acetylase OafA/YrhL